MQQRKEALLLLPQSVRRVSVFNLDRARKVLAWRRNYWPQTTDFTCGPSCLLMAAKMLGVPRQFRQLDEYLIWRRANTLYMGEGQAGCSAEGLALAALRMGLKASIVQDRVLPLFSREIGMDRQHARLMRAVVLDDRRHFIKIGGNVESRQGRVSDVENAVLNGDAVLCLIREPEGGILHWVVAVGAEQGRILVLDPWAPGRESPDEPVVYPRAVFDGMICHGRAGCLLLLAR